MMGFLAATALVALALPAAAQDPSVVGSWPGLPLHEGGEAPFWSETIPAGTGLEVALTTHDQMGLGAGDVFDVPGSGVHDVAMTVADAPEPAGLDVAMNAASARVMVDAARPMRADIYADRSSPTFTPSRPTRRRSCSATRRSRGWTIWRASRFPSRAG